MKVWTLSHALLVTRHCFKSLVKLGPVRGGHQIYTSIRKGSRPLSSRPGLLSQHSSSSTGRRMSSETRRLEETETYKYSEADFIHQIATWADKSPPQISKFDKAVYERWDQAMANGVFRYNIDHIVTRIIPGSKQYVAQLNTLRATERRKPQVITSVSQPFNPKAFNFNWVKREEIIFDMRKRLAENGTPSSNGVCNGAELNGEATNGAASENHSASQGDEQGERHCLIVNVSPMEYGHCLLLPQVDLMQPQVLTQRAFEVAVETMLLSQHRGFRLGFNSLCAFASVNHLHFHAYYLNYELIVDHCPVGHLAGKYYEFTALPCPGFCMQLHGSTVEELSREAFKLSSYFHNADIAHNVYICRGTVFGEERDSKLTTVRVFIWPRKKYIGTKSSDEFNVACIELGGHLPIKEEEGYHRFTEEDVDAIVDAANLSRGDYLAIRKEVVRMGLESSALADSDEEQTPDL